MYKRTWREYRTAGGGRPIRDFLFSLSDEDRAAILEEMEYVRCHGRKVARHIRGEIYEVRVNYNAKIYRILFACQGHFDHILLSLEGFQKKTQLTPPKSIKLAEQRLADWKLRGERHKQIKRTKGES